MGLQGRPHLLKPVAALVGEEDLAQFLKQLPSSHFSSANGLADIGDAPGMLYPHGRRHGLEPAARELGSTVPVNGAGTPETVSQSQIIMTANSLASHPFLRAGTDTI